MNKEHPHNPADTSLGYAIRKARLDMGMTQLDLAKVIGISDKTLSTWENNKVYPSSEFIISIAMCTHTDFYRFLPHTTQYHATIDNPKYAFIVDSLPQLDDESLDIINKLIVKLLRMNNASKK